MKISLIIPPEKSNWLGNIIAELKELRHEVMINDCDESCDVILGMTHTQWRTIKHFHELFPEISLYTLNWDWYDYINKSKDGWPEFIQLMKESKEVWSADKYTADMCENDTGIKSDVYLYGFILPWEWKGENRDWGYIIMGSRQDPNKRFDWYERATKELDIPYKAYHPESNSREDYIRTLKNCSYLVMASREESIGGLTPMEASYCKKPILVSDCDGCKEVWGDDAVYFKKDSYEDFKKQMKTLWENYKNKDIQEKVERAYKKVNDRFLPDKQMVQTINKRICEQI